MQQQLAHLLLSSIAIVPMLRGVDQGSELPESARCAISAMERSMDQISIHHHQQLAAVRNASLIELDAEFSKAIDAGDVRGASAIWHAMNAIIASCRLLATPWSAEPTAGVDLHIAGAWILTDDATGIVSHYIEISEGGQSCMVPISMCQGQRRVVFERFRYNQHPRNIAER